MCMARIKIIGTSHIASQSVRQIKKAFCTGERPDIVAIELDKERAKRIFEEPGVPRVRDMYKLGVMGYAFARVGSYVQQKFGARVGMTPGEDVRTAMRESKRYAVPLFLIDQPIQITLRNISSKMSFWEKSKLAFYACGIVVLPFVSFFSKKTKKVNLTKVPATDLITDSLEAMKKNFPGLYTALITDRNKHMVRHVKYLATRFPDKNILVVVGAGHRDALKKALVEPAIAS